MLEHFFVVFLFSGVFKDFFLFFYLDTPIDFTLFSAIVAICFLSYRILITNKLRINFSVRNKLVLVTFLLFWLWMVISLFYSPSPQYSLKKTFLFSTNFVTIILVALGSLDVKKVIRYFIFYTYLFSSLYLPVLIGTQMGTLPYSYMRDLSGLYLTLGLNLGAIVLILKFSHQPVFNTNTDKYLSILTFILLILIGARGALLIAIFAIILYYSANVFRILRKNIRFTRRKLIFSTFTIASLAALIIYFKDIISALMDRSLARLAYIISSDKGSSINARIEHMDKSFQLLKDPLIFIKGIGIGSYMYVTQHQDIRGYPHNIILEVWVELGIIGVIFFLMNMFSYLSCGRKSEYISKLLLLYLFLNLLKSSSLVDMRLVIGFFMLYIDGNKNFDRIVYENSVHTEYKTDKNQNRVY